MRVPSLKERVVQLPWSLWFNGTCIYPFIFLTTTAGRNTKRHERIHWAQQDRWWRGAGPFGWIAWFFLYLFVLPVGWNPWRWKWEYEAFRNAQGYLGEHITKILQGGSYQLWWMEADNEGNR